MSIQPRYLPLTELLENRLFRIPHYQRAYSWQRKQRSDMFSDILALGEDIRNEDSAKDKVHFMATVVGLHRDTRTIVTDEYSIIEIVDGQQRLTTLVLLLKAIEMQLDSSVPTEKRLAQDLRDLLVKSDEASLILLQTNHDRSQYFANFLRNGEYPPVEEAETHADHELLRAIYECEKFVSEWSNRIELTRIIKNHLTFIFHEIDDEASVYTVFEVLNNRGLAVAWLDRLKSMLMSVAFEDNRGNSSEHIDELHDIWGKIYEKIGIQDKLAEEVLKFSGTLKSPVSIRTIRSEEKAVTNLRELDENTAAGAIEVSKWLLKVTEALDRFYRESRSFMTRIAHARLLAVAISLQDFSSDEKRVLLAEWETTTFYIFVILRRDARVDVGNYVKLAWDTLNNRELDADDISKKIKKIRMSWGVYMLRENLDNTDLYSGWREQLRYLLFRYEEYLAEQQGQRFSNEQWNRIWKASSFESIEHIQPQWTLFGPELRDLPEIGNIHRLGNLLLLPPKLNSSLSNKKPEEKADAYIKTGFFMAQEVGWTIKKEGWCMKQVEEREQRIIEWISREWEIVNERDT